VKRKRNVLQQRYGLEAGTRTIDEMLRGQERPTIPAPRMTMLEMIKADREERSR
jgi:hypothetical protein